MESLLKPDFLLAAGYKGLRIVAIVLVAALACRLGGLVIDRVFHPPAGVKKLLEEKRARTLSARPGASMSTSVAAVIRTRAGPSSTEEPWPSVRDRIRFVPSSTTCCICVIPRNVSARLPPLLRIPEGLRRGGRPGKGRGATASS